VGRMEGGFPQHSTFLWKAQGREDSHLRPHAYHTTPPWEWKEGRRCLYQWSERGIRGRAEMSHTWQPQPKEPHTSFL